MKATAIILFILLFGVIAFTFIKSMESSDLHRTQQSLIDGLRKENEKQKDSLQAVLKVTQDSLQIAFNSIRQAAIERQAAHERSQRIIKNYEKILFIRYASDSARHRKLSELFNTYPVPR